MITTLSTWFESDSAKHFTYYEVYKGKTYIFSSATYQYWYAVAGYL